MDVDFWDVDFWEVDFCIEPLQEALAQHGKPEIFRACREFPPQSQNALGPPRVVSEMGKKSYAKPIAATVAS